MVLFALLCIPALAVGQTVPVDSVKADSLRIKQQQVKPPAEDFSRQFDVGDLFNLIFHPNGRKDSLKKKPSGITIIPNVASNPSIGSQIGIKAVAGRKLGADPKTLMSVAATSASITTKGIIYFYINHNVFTNANHWNLQGSLVAAKPLRPILATALAKQIMAVPKTRHLLMLNVKGMCSIPFSLTLGRRFTRKLSQTCLWVRAYHLI